MKSDMKAKDLQLELAQQQVIGGTNITGAITVISRYGIYSVESSMANRMPGAVLCHLPQGLLAME